MISFNLWLSFLHASLSELLEWIDYFESWLLYFMIDLTSIFPFNWEEAYSLITASLLLISDFDILIGSGAALNSL